MNQAVTPLLLIVDDSRTSRMLIKALVGRLRPDWRIAEAENGDQALAAIADQPPAYVSLDVNMPGMSGLEVAGRVRLRYPDIGVVLCTANVQDSVRQAAEKAHVQFVGKPITEQTITRMIEHFETFSAGQTA